MSWHRKHNTKHTDKRESYLILRMIEAQKQIIERDVTIPSPMQRQFMAELAVLEAKTRAEWSR